jgi:hypothetical protein
MLLSHRYQFIFIKTVKTAGTSVESYFEPYCMFDGEWEQSHARNEYVSEAGIIGARAQRHQKLWKRQLRKPKYRNHMPAWEIKNLVGDNIWNNYFKFTVVRNPFDKLVSKYLFKEMKINNYYGKVHLFSRKLKSMMSTKKSPLDCAEGETEIERFRSWLKNGANPVDRDKYMIENHVCVDYFIRFENLQEDIKEVCERLSLPFDPKRIPEFKKGHRNNEIPVKDYYDQETEDIVRNLYDWEIKKFGYKMPG